MASVEVISHGRRKGSLRSTPGGSSAVDQRPGQVSSYLVDKRVLEAKRVSMCTVRYARLQWSVERSGLGCSSLRRWEPRAQLAQSVTERRDTSDPKPLSKTGRTLSRYKTSLMLDLLTTYHRMIIFDFIGPAIEETPCKGAERGERGGKPFN